MRRSNLLRAALAVTMASAALPATAGAQSGSEHGAASWRAGSEGVATQQVWRHAPKGWSAGEVHRWTGYSRPGGSRRVREVQRRLNRLGYESGPVDGLFGPITERAVRRFQNHMGLAADAVVGPRTLRVLRRLDRRSRGDRVRSSRTPHGRGGERVGRPSVIPTGQTPATIPHGAKRPTGVRVGPELPVVPVVVAFALLGVGAFAASYARTTTAIRRAHEAQAVAMRTPRAGDRPHGSTATPAIPRRRMPAGHGSEAAR